MRRQGPQRPMRGPNRYELGRGREPSGPQLNIPWGKLGGPLLAAGGAALLIALALWLVRGDALRVDDVDVVGASVADVAAIEAAANLEGQSVLKLDTGGASERVSRVPGVKKAAVRRDFPRGAVVAVTEYEGWGYWQVAGFSHVIDREGVVHDLARTPPPNAPTIIDASSEQPLEPGMRVDADTVALVARLLDDGTFQRLGLQPDRFEFDAQRGLTVHVGGGPAAVFGDSHDYEFKVAAWAALLQRVKARELQAKEFDLRFGRELVVR